MKDEALLIKQLIDPKTKNTAFNVLIKLYKERLYWHIRKIVIVHDGSAVTLTQYGTMKSKSLATFDADISGSDLRLLCTPASTSSTVVKFDRLTVDA